METFVVCARVGCEKPAVEVLFIRGWKDGQHLHECSRHGAEVREWDDVIWSRPMLTTNTERGQVSRCPYPCNNVGGRVVKSTYRTSEGVQEA